jgi:endonuclease/exonuclease/phosphatase (EEP) superfamily protein YafD
MNGLLKLAAWVLFMLTGLGFLGQLHWVFELIAPFRLQYFSLLLLLSLYFGTRGDRQLFFVAFMAAIINGWLVLPVFFEAAPAPRAKGHQLRLVQMNLSTRNTRHTQAIRVIESLKPDVLALEEVSADWRQALNTSKTLKKLLPYKAQSVDSQTSLYSRYPIRDIKIHQVNPKYPVDNLLSAKISLPSQRLTVLVAHPPHPTSAQENWRQIVVFSYMIAHEAHFKAPFVLAGDLNTTPWSHHFQALIRQMHLLDSRAGFGIHPTWPDKVWLLRIPIDHVLVSPDIMVNQHEVAMSTGSDHLPIVVDLVIK